jgi:hypothetical protein
VAYPLDHAFAFEEEGTREQGTMPSWPTDEELLRRENLERFVGSATTATTADRPEFEFYTAFTDPTTQRPDLAGERGFDVPPPVRAEWTRVESTTRLQDVMALYTLVFLWQPAEKADEVGLGRLLLFGLRHKHTWEMQSLALVQREATKVGLEVVTVSGF